MRKAAAFDEHDTASEIVRTLYTFPDTVRSLHLCHIDGNIAPILRKTRNTQSHLEELFIDSCAIIKESPAQSGRRLNKVLLDCEQLQTLSIKNVPFEMKRLLNTFASLEHLRSLTLGNNAHLSTHELMTVLLNTPSLEAVHLYRISQLTEQDVQFLFCNGRLSGQLRHLTLDRVLNMSPGSYDVRAEMAKRDAKKNRINLFLCVCVCAKTHRQLTTSTLWPNPPNLLLSRYSISCCADASNRCTSSTVRHWRPKLYYKCRPHFRGCVVCVWNASVASIRQH